MKAFKKSPMTRIAGSVAAAAVIASGAMVTTTAYAADPIDGDIPVTQPVEEPISDAPVDETPVEEAPVEETPVEEVPVEEAPVEEAPAEEVPAEEAPVEEAPVEEVPAVEVPVEEAPVEEVPAVEVPVEEAPVEEVPAVEVPVEEAPVEEVPAEEVPVEEAPVEEAPVEEAPAEEAPVEEAPVVSIAEATPVFDFENRVIVLPDVEGVQYWVDYFDYNPGEVVPILEETNYDFRVWMETPDGTVTDWIVNFDDRTIKGEVVSDPVDPEPTDPAEPVDTVDPEPTDPVVPVDPVDPEPTDPAETVDPVDPEPTDPAETVDPVDPEPTDSDNPVTTADYILVSSEAAAPVFDFENRVIVLPDVEGVQYWIDYFEYSPGEVVPILEETDYAFDVWMAPAEGYAFDDGSVETIVWTVNFDTAEFSLVTPEAPDDGDIPSDNDGNVDDNVDGSGNVIVDDNDVDSSVDNNDNVDNTNRPVDVVISDGTNNGDGSNNVNRNIDNGYDSDSDLADTGAPLFGGVFAAIAAIVAGAFGFRRK